MEQVGRPVTYLTSQEIAGLNRKTILRTGGFGSCAGLLRSPSSLDYVVELVTSKLAGVELYPSLLQKAAAYAYHIISKHIFWDGNKRTGMACAFWFLELNGLLIPESVHQDQIVHVAVGIASGALGFQDIVDSLQNWLT